MNALKLVRLWAALIVAQAVKSASRSVEQFAGSAPEEHSPQRWTRHSASSLGFASSSQELSDERQRFVLLWSDTARSHRQSLPQFRLEPSRSFRRIRPEFVRHAQGWR